jgi:hypothetical protein
MSIKDSIARSHNLLVTSVLFFAGVGFFGSGMEEKEVIDKLDDFGLLAISIIILIWYLVGRNRFNFTPVPMFIAIVAALLQLIWIFIEKDDPADLGDNIGGMFLYGTFALFSIYHFLATKKMMAEQNE